MDTFTQQLLRRATGNPEYEKLMEYLTLRRMRPTVSVYTPQRDPTQQAVFSSPKDGAEVFWMGPAGAIEMEYGPNAPEAIPTLIHELTHAADRQIRKQSAEPGATPVFRDTANKLRNQPMRVPGKSHTVESPRQSLARKLSPEWRDSEEYRASHAELPAWAVESTQAAPSSRPGPTHLDPTLATEFMILLEAAIKDQKTRPIMGR